MAIAACLVMTACVSLPVDSDRSVVLTGAEARRLLHQCSRATPENVQELWIPSPEQIGQLEAALGSVRRSKASQCCLVGGKVREPGEAYRQYTGVVVGSRRLIYVNAFEGEQPDWQGKAIVLCDGGLSAWGVIFDPETGRFEDLAINGEA